MKKYCVFISFLIVINIFVSYKAKAVTINQNVIIDMDNMCMYNSYIFLENYSSDYVTLCSEDGSVSFKKFCSIFSSSSYIEYCHQLLRENYHTSECDNLLRIYANPTMLKKAQLLCDKVNNDDMKLTISEKFEVSYSTCITKDYKFFENYSKDYIKSCSESNTISFSQLCKTKDNLTISDVTIKARIDAMCTKLGLEENEQSEYNQNIGEYKDQIEKTYFNENSPLCEGSNQIGSYYSKDSLQNMSTGCAYIQEYGPVEEKYTYPGGPYTTGFTYKSKMFCSYISSYDCKFIQYTTGNGYWVSCEESSLPGSGSSSYSPNININWNIHPSRVVLTEDINDATKVYMEYVKESDDFNYSGSISAPQLKPGVIRNPDLLNDYTKVENENISSNLKKELGATNLYTDTDNKTYQTITLEDGSVALNVYKVTQQTTTGTDNFSFSGGSYCSLGTFTDNSESNASSYETSYAEAHKDAKAVCSASTSSTSATCGCTRDDCPEGSTGTMESITYNCSVSWTQTWNTYFLSSYSTYAVAETGRYELKNTINYSGRFESIVGKLIPISATTGTYNYIIYSENPDTDLFGKRKCNLYVTKPDDPDPPIPPDPDPPKHWTDLLDFRIINISNPFPGRQPRSNWSFDSSIIKEYINSSKSDVMYHIELTRDVMKKIKEETTIQNYTGWSLKADYIPSIDGIYNWAGDHEYSWSIGGLKYANLQTLRDLGATIKANSNVVIERNKELLQNGFNSYSRSREQVLK